MRRNSTVPRMSRRHGTNTPLIVPSWFFFFFGFDGDDFEAANGRSSELDICKFEAAAIGE